ncbi:MAG: hypothetical protein ACRD3Q_21435 [Terriglobales bacterium]
MSAPETDARVVEAVRSIRALRNLTKMTGNITRRTQSEILAALPGEVLVTVAQILTETEENDRGQLR